MRLNNTSALFLIFSLFCSIVMVVDSFRYLAVLHSALKSHFIFSESLLKALAAKGHEVFVISPFPQEYPVKNYYDITFEAELTEHYEHESHHDIVEAFNKSNKVPLNILRAVFSPTNERRQYILDNYNVEKLMFSGLRFDAVICEIFFTESLYGLSEHFRAPLIGISTIGVTPYDTYMVGSPSPPSYVPSFRSTFGDHMSFSERARNLAAVFNEEIYMKWSHLPSQAALYRKHFPTSKRDMYEVLSNAALVLVNTHFSFARSRPYMPNHIGVAGMHIKEESEYLPWDVHNFIEDAEYGVVYYAMGPIVKAVDKSSKEKIQVFLKAFENIEQKVIWSGDHPMLAEKFENIFTSTWLPQNDILAHENVKVFITHGGSMSIVESIYHGIPIIGIPKIGDQFSNVAKAVADGYAISLDYQTLTAEDISQAIDRIIANGTYLQRAKELSERFKDQPMLAKDLAVLWVEHIAQYKGAKYLHCAGLDLNFFQYHNIDAMIVLVLYMIFHIYTFFWMLIPYVLSLLRSASNMFLRLWMNTARR